MNEFFDFQHHIVMQGVNAGEISVIWECLDHIRTKDTHPAECGYTLEQIQLASEWNNQFNPDYSYLEKFM